MFTFFFFIMMFYMEAIIFQDITKVLSFLKLILGKKLNQAQ